MFDLAFFNKKTILVTGHTGFKGTWLCKILINAGANVIGYALKPADEESLFQLSKVEAQMTSIIGDVRDLKHLKEVFCKYQPELVIHMAAQPLVLSRFK